MLLIVHAGTPKTGTTSLQENLARQSDLLLRHGILYPLLPDGRRDHNLLTTMLLPREGWARGFRDKPDSIRDAARALWEHIAARARRLQPAVTVLSAEFFFAMPVEAWRQFRAMADEVFSDTRVVAYVREPAGQYLSRLQQAVKGSGEIAAPARSRFIVRRRVETMREAFGGAVELRGFGPGMLAGDCVVRDFLSRLPVEDAPVFDVVRANESLSAEAVYILQRAHQLALPQVGRITPASSRLVAALGRLPGGTRARLRPGVAPLLRAAAAAELAWLDEQFGIRFPSDDEPPPAEPPPAWRATDAAAILDVDPASAERMLYELLVTLLQDARADPGAQA